MGRLRHDIYKDAVRSIQQELIALQISQRAAAGHIGIAHSTFNAFLNQEYSRPNMTTVEKISRVPIWTDNTRQRLKDLQDYEARLFCREA